MFALTRQNGSRRLSIVVRELRGLVGSVAAFLYDPDRSWIAERNATRVMSRLEWS